jgi:hypothetical protein
MHQSCLVFRGTGHPRLENLGTCTEGKFFGGRTLPLAFHPSLKPFLIAKNNITDPIPIFLVQRFPRRIQARGCTR